MGSRVDLLGGDRGTTCAPPDGADRSPADVGGLLKSLRGEELRCTKGQLSQKSARAVKGKTSLGMAHEHFPNLSNPHAQGSIGFEQICVGPKAHVRVCQARKPVLDENARVHPEMWSRPVRSLLISSRMSV